MGSKQSKPKDEPSEAPPKVSIQSQKSMAMHDTFEALDADKSGFLDFNEVQAGLKKLGYPPNYAFDVFVQLDQNKEHHISYEEFKTWVDAKYDDMKELFDSVDRDGSGQINLKELELMLCHLDLPTTNAQDLMNQLDKDGDKLISFQEFQAGFSLLSPVHFSALKDTWMEYESDSDLAGVSAISVSHTAKREESKTVPAWTSAVAGGVANGFSRTVIAPLERTRVQMIADAGKYPSMMACMKDVIKNEGIVGFWAGNTLNVGRITPQMAITFYAKDFFKSAYAGEGNKPTALQTLAASMSCGVCGQTAMYPIDLIRTRMMTSPGTYEGIADCLSQTIKTEGITALYKGLLPANMFAVPYHGTMFFVYDMLKVQYSTFGRTPEEGPRPANPLIGIPLGSLSSMMACFVAFPFQMAWKRLQVQGVGGRPVLYDGTFDCIKKVVAKEGIRKGVYAGLVPNLIKLAPSGAISFMAVEAIKDYMGWRPGKM